MKYIDIPAMRRSATILKLCEKPITPAEISKQIGITKNTTSSHLKKLMAAREIHIAFWCEVVTVSTHREYRSTTPHYLAGDGESAIKPVVKNWQRSKAYREKLRNGHVPVKKADQEKEPTVRNFKKQSWVSQLYAA